MDIPFDTRYFNSTKTASLIISIHLTWHICYFTAMQIKENGNQHETHCQCCFRI